MRLDVFDAETFGLLELIHLNLVVEMADVANDGLIFHREHVRGGDDVAVAGGGDVNITNAQRAFDGVDLETFHRGLQRVDGINFRDDDA